MTLTEEARPGRPCPQGDGRVRAEGDEATDDRDSTRSSV